MVILNKKLWESQLPTEMQMAREVSHGPMLIASGTRAKCGPRSLDRNLEKYGNLKSPIYFVTKKKEKGTQMKNDVKLSRKLRINI